MAPVAPRPWRRNALATARRNGRTRGGGAGGAPSRREAGGGRSVPNPLLPVEPPAGYTTGEWKVVRDKQLAALRLQAEASKEVSTLHVEPPAGYTAEEWQQIRERNAAAIQQAEKVAASKLSPQQLLQAAEKAERRHQDLQRQLETAGDRHG